MENISRVELEDLIDERIKFTLKYAFENSPFYRELFQKIGFDPYKARGREDLEYLPIINSNIMRSNQPPHTPEYKFLSAPIEKIFSIHETGGTSGGEPKSIFMTNDDWEAWQIKGGRLLKNIGCTSEDLMLNCIGHGVGASTFMAVEAARGAGMKVITACFSAFPPRYELIQRYKPTVLHHIPSGVIKLAREMKSKGIDPKNTSIEKIWIAGEATDEYMRNYIAELWDADVFNLYGSTEGGAIAGECKEHSGLHLNEDYLFFDLRDPNDLSEPSKSYEGVGILTTLIEPGKYSGTVLINFNTEDFIEIYSKEKCKCGSSFLRIKDPIRASDVIHLKDEKIKKTTIESAVLRCTLVDERFTGEWELFVDKDEKGNHLLDLRLESGSSNHEGLKNIAEDTIFSHDTKLKDILCSDKVDFRINIRDKGNLDFYSKPGKPKRIVDRRRI